MPQAAEQQGEGGEAQVGFSLSAASREEQQVHDLTIVRLPGLGDRAGNARKVQEDERQLERTPDRLLGQLGELRRLGLGLERQGGPAASVQGQDFVGGAEGIQDLGVRQGFDATLDAVGGLGRPLDQEGGSLGPGLGGGRGGLGLGGDPGLVVGDQPDELQFGGVKVPELGQGFHAELGLAVELGGLYPLDLRHRYPGGSDGRAQVTGFKALGTDAVADGELELIPVLKVGDAVIDLLAAEASQINSGHKAVLRLHDQLHLEGERLVLQAVQFLRGPPVDHEERDRPGALGVGVALGQVLGADAPRGQRQDHPLGPRDLSLLRGLRVRGRHLQGQDDLPGGALPVVAALLDRLVVAPANGDLEVLGLRAHQEGQPHGRGEGAGLGGGAVGDGIVVEPPAIGDLFHVLRGLLVAALGQVGPQRGKESREIPPRGVSLQGLVGLPEAHAWSDHVQTQGVDEIGPNSSCASHMDCLCFLSNSIASSCSLSLSSCSPSGFGNESKKGDHLAEIACSEISSYSP